ncbi:MAG: N-terminal phage integrase SAM-like domain-containing protein, partial [Jatrophihabitantaceae bacterium]
MANIDDRWTSPASDGRRDPNARHGRGLRWRARYYDAAGTQHSQHFARRIEAQKWLDSVTTAVGTGSYVDPARSKTLVRTVAAEWLAGKLNLKETTRVRYENALDVHVLPRWGDTPLVAVEHAAIQAWLAELLASGQAGASVRKIHGVFSAILDLAVRD